MRSGARHGGNDRVMMRRLSSSIELRLVILASVLALAAGCAKKPDADATAGGSGTGSEFDDAGAGAGDGMNDGYDPNAGASIAPIYFDLDQSDIKPQFESILEPAIRFAVGDTLVCDGIQEARRIAFGQNNNNNKGHGMNQDSRTIK